MMLTQSEREAVETVQRWSASGGWNVAPIELHPAVRTLLALADRLAAPPPAPATDDGAFLAAVEARLDGRATKETWEDHGSGYVGVTDGEGPAPIGQFDEPTNATLAAHAPADLARLVALVREVEGLLADYQADTYARFREGVGWAVAFLRGRARKAYSTVAALLADEIEAETPADPPPPPWRLREECGRYRAALEEARANIHRLGFGGVTALTATIDKTLGEIS